MALIWHMTINFGSVDRRLGWDKEKIFDFKPLLLDDKVVTFHVGSELNSSGLEVYVVPWVGMELLNGHGGPANDAEVEDLNATAKVFYERLRRTDGYQFALVGTEVGDWRSPDEVVDLLQDQEFPYSTLQGLIISQNLFEKAGKPEHFVPFSEGYVWVPWRSEVENLSRRSRSGVVDQHGA